MINHRYDWNEKCLFYFLTCNKCKMKYLGYWSVPVKMEQLQKWHSRKHDQGATCMQQHLFNRFCTSGNCGFLEHVSLTFIGKSNPSDLLKREDYWRSTLKTVAPFGLNIEESILQFYLQYLEVLFFYRTGMFWGQRFLDTSIITGFFLFLMMLFICCHFRYYLLLFLLSLLLSSLLLLLLWLSLLPLFLFAFVFTIVKLIIVKLIIFVVIIMDTTITIIIIIIRHLYCYHYIIIILAVFVAVFIKVIAFVIIIIVATTISIIM